MGSRLNKFTFSVLTLLVTSASAQQTPSTELTCRAKAKEIAAQTYSSCMTVARNSQIDQIRKDYQKQIAELKSKYDLELKKVGEKGLSATPPAKKSAPAVTNVTKPPKPTKGIAKTLPTRSETKTAPPVIEEVLVEKTVVVPETVTPNIEGELPQNDADGDLRIELVPEPAANDQTAAATGEQNY